MYEITISKSFSAAHTIKDIGGMCEELHGHNFVVDVSLVSDRVSKEGLVVDFRVVKEWTDEILGDLDHRYLNDHPAFQRLNPSAENLARFIFERVMEKTQGKEFAVSSITVWESDNARATYRG